jgi:hypothetical protein
LFALPQDLRRRGFGLVIHPDAWNWEDRDSDHYRWREHDGQGHWRNGVWVTF